LNQCKAKGTSVSAPRTILDKYTDYQMDIGIEVHVQLNTKSKIFCSSENGQSEIPNSAIDPICAGYPGTLPMVNKQVINDAILVGLATNCTINTINEFARKHYFYPDLPKGYQISQDEHPICVQGYVPIRLEDGTIKNIRLRRIHMEEDAGKNIHVQGINKSLVDLNRAGSPLLEIVSEPDIKSTEEAKIYLKTLHAIVTYLGICSGSMEEGVFRADTNISIRRKNDPVLGTRCELKNINSFKFIGDAIEYEAERHIKLLEQGQKVIQETRLWNTEERKSFAMRTKEEAADYRYFPDPDLPKIFIDEAWITTIRGQLPELPQQKFERFKRDYNLKNDEVEILIHDLRLAHYFEQAAQKTKSPLLINWVLRDVIGYIKENKINLIEIKITPEKLAALVELIQKGVINTRAAQEIFTEIAETGKEPHIIVQEKGLQQVGDIAELEKIVQEIINDNPQQAAAYRSGKTQLFGFFVGQAMAKTKGRGNPQIINELLKKHL
jgi:aspartyl-tRNA(Asn)/glutamyl-tRNA(Gln) amidotransferase subunit B